jgi:thiamine-phosphate pyrophosphorylase
LAFHSDPLPDPPPGIWAIASNLQNLTEAQIWMENAASATAWTFRLPNCSERVSIELLHQLRNRARFLAVHGRQDWAKIVSADAWVEGSRSLAPELLPQWGGLCRLRSTHSLEEVRHCAEVGECTALFFGPIWETPSKKGILQPQGLNNLKTACQAGIPIIALGGIETPEQVAMCKAAGVHAVAVLRAARSKSTLSDMAKAIE